MLFSLTAAELSTVPSKEPTFTVSPSFTAILPNTPLVGEGTSTLTLSNSNSANTPVYFYVRYKIHSGNWNTVVTNQSVAKNASTTLTQSVPHGSVITWTYLTSTTSNTFSGSGTEVASSTVNCLYIDPSASQSLAGSCSSGADTSTLTLANSNSANTTAYFLVEYSVDGGSNWTQKAANQSVSQNGSATLTQSVAHGTAITWRYKSSTSSGSFSGSYVTSSDMNSATVDCPYIDTTVSQSLGSCSSGAATSTLTLANSNSASTTAYFYVRYKQTLFILLRLKKIQYIIYNYPYIIDVDYK